jgi:hypothetical protein
VEFLFVHISTKAAVIGLQMQPAVKAFLETSVKKSATFLSLVDLLVVAIFVVQRVFCKDMRVLITFSIQWIMEVCSTVFVHRSNFISK